MKFNQFGKKLFLMTAMVCGLFGANSLNAFAQFTFVGDFDRANFAAPNGYYVEPQNNYPQDATNPARVTSLFTGDYAPDGSIIAGGNIATNRGTTFWLRKFTPSGTPDTSFGGGTGYVRTIFSTEFGSGLEGESQASVLKRQPDGKIVFGGVCRLQIDQANANSFGEFGIDWCLVRYNADGSIDNSFGNNIVQYSNGPNITYSQFVGAGRVATQTNTRDNGLLGGTGLSAQLSDLAIQPDGKIVAVGYTRSETNPYFQGVGTFRTEGIVVRYNANGSLDTTFGTNGIARFVPSNSGTAAAPCYGQREFYGVRLQPDGRIIAVGYDGVGVVSGGCSAGGTFFVVTRWTANGQLETVRRLNADTNVFARENAVAALITNDGGKLLVSGSYQGTEALVRFNLSDLTVDTTFGTNGVVSYIGTGNNRMSIKAIQPDGKILGFDPATNYPVLRLNPNGSPDNSFGNQIFSLSDMNVKGRADLPVFTVNNTAQVAVGHILLRPNGKFNLIGAGLANFGGPNARALVSQNINALHTNNTADFTNDGKADIAVFRSGTWYYLNSATNQFNGVSFGQAGDLPVPADYDGDGKADVAVYRGGTWYILQSSTNSLRGVAFGASGDLPRPGDFDGDGRADIGVFRPSTGAWYILRSSDNQFSGISFGQNGDVPLLADFDGDGKSDIAVFRSGIWYYLQSSDGGFRAVSFGLSTDVPTVGDYDGDGRSDISVFRPSNGFWYRLNSSTGAFVFAQFGQNGDRPVPADYDNDGKTDLAIFRAGTWYGLRSGDNSVFGTAFGAAADVPVPAAYLP